MATAKVPVLSPLSYKCVRTPSRYGHEVYRILHTVITWLLSVGQTFAYCVSQISEIQACIFAGTLSLLKGTNLTVSCNYLHCLYYIAMVNVSVFPKSCDKQTSYGRLNCKAKLLYCIHISFAPRIAISRYAMFKSFVGKLSSTKSSGNVSIW